MKRRSFFATLLGGLLCRFLPKRKVEPIVEPTRVDFLDMRYWGGNLGDSFHQAFVTFSPISNEITHFCLDSTGKQRIVAA